MAIDRSKFKKTSASQLVQADKELNKTMGKKEKQGNGHEIEEGANLFRFYPVHPDIAEKDPKAVFAVPFVQTFVPAMVKEKDKDGKEIMEGGQPKMKLGVKPVVNAKVHGGYAKDLIEEFIRCANKNAKDMGLKDKEYKEYMKPIYGAFSKDPKQNVNGINYPQVWIVYADKYPNANAAATPVFDELRLKKSIKERLNKIAAVEAANDPMGTDPFTDIEDGRAVKILKDTTTDNPQNIYTTELDSSTTKEILNGRTVNVQVTFPLTDVQLEHFMKQEPLQEKYGKKLATRKNFEAQLAGLELLDQKYSMGIFDMPEWSDIVLEIDGYYPENDPTNNGGSDDTDSTTEEVEDVVSGDEFDLMERKELTAFAKEYKTGILVRPNLSDDELRNKLREWKANDIPHKPLPTDADYVEQEEKPTHKVAELGKDSPEERQAFLDDLNGKTSAPAEVANRPMTSKEKLEALRAKKNAA